MGTDLLEVDLGFALGNRRSFEGSERRVHGTSENKSER